MLTVETVLALQQMLTSTVFLNFAFGVQLISGKNMNPGLAALLTPAGSMSNLRYFSFQSYIFF